MSATATPQASAMQASVAPIGFRPEGPTAGGSLAVLGALVAVLALAVVGLWLAQRRGWLKAWTAIKPAAAAQRLVVEERVRLSPKTVIYRVRDAEHSFHVIESTAHVTVQRP
ncbi:hypothetical protein ACFFGH_09085 [Lysobacter korlensis]|uniref:Flagellar biosynthesis protein FliO n=1 Tax=Lysobacter korlensis TaxID=553636 RepID=A0ABV6RN58_9GAMM